MEKGTIKGWTPELEAYFKRLIDMANGFAERFMITNVRNILKYDNRTIEYKRARSKAHLALFAASDEELKELAELQHLKMDSCSQVTVDDLINHWKEIQKKIRTEGITKDLLVIGKTSSRPKQGQKS